MLGITKNFICNDCSLKEDSIFYYHHQYNILCVNDIFSKCCTNKICNICEQFKNKNDIISVYNIIKMSIPKISTDKNAIIEHLIEMLNDLNIGINECICCGWIDSEGEIWYQCYGCEENICKKCYDNHGDKKKKIYCEKCYDPMLEKFHECTKCCHYICKQCYDSDLDNIICDKCQSDHEEKWYDCEICEEYVCKKCYRGNIEKIVCNMSIKMILFINIIFVNRCYYQWRLFCFNMISMMSPRELYFFRQTTKYLYGIITLDMIYDKIVKLACEKLQIIFMDKYDEFMNMIKNRKIVIHGPFVTKIIWGEQQQTDIDMIITASDIGTKDDNVFLDYMNIDTQYDPGDQYEQTTNCLDWEPDDTIILNNNVNGNKLSLIALSDRVSFTHYPLVFRNKMEVVNNELKIFMTDIKTVMHKAESINLARTDDDYTDYYDDESGGYRELSSLASKYQVTCRCSPFTTSVSVNHSTQLMVYKDGKFTLLGSCFQSTKNDRISCLPMTVINNDNIDQLYVDFKLQPFEIQCSQCSCPFMALHQHIPIPHFHACIFLKKLGKWSFN